MAKTLVRTTTISTPKANNNNSLATTRLINMDKTTIVTIILNEAEITIEIVDVIVSVLVRTVNPLITVTTTVKVDEKPLDLDPVTGTEKNLNKSMKTSNLFRT